MPGNPEAVFEVVQLPTGEILDAQLRKSSGVKAYDDAVARAILKSSPLPRPDRAEHFSRTLTLRFRPPPPAYCSSSASATPASACTPPASS